MKQEFLDKLAAVVSTENIAFNEPMSKHTTFRIGGTADVFVTPKVSEVADIVRLANDRHRNFVLFG